MESYENGEAIHSVDTNSVLTNTFFRMFLGLIASAGTFFLYCLENFLLQLLLCYFLHMHF